MIGPDSIFSRAKTNLQSSCTVPYRACIVTSVAWTIYIRTYVMVIVTVSRGVSLALACLKNIGSLDLDTIDIDMQR
jgi:hypothetical protein